MILAALDARRRRRRTRSPSRGPPSTTSTSTTRVATSAPTTRALRDRRLARPSILCARVLRNLSRQPIWIVVMIVQPMFWLLLYSQLFRRITELPGLRDDVVHRLPHPRGRRHDGLLLRLVGGDGDDRGPRPRRPRAVPRDAREPRRDRLRPHPRVGDRRDAAGGADPRSPGSCSGRRTAVSSAGS